VLGWLPESDHFSASVEPQLCHPRLNVRPEAAGLTGKKAFHAMEPKGFVAAPSQLRTIDEPASPRSNLIQATLFGLISQR
jgi:hypothetical protein